MISGWGITQTGVIHEITLGLVDRRLANAIHRAANVPLALFFSLHVFTNIQLGLRTNRSAVRWIVAGVLVLAGFLIMWLVVYLAYFRLGG